jgi:hypothetical protein
MVRVLPARAIQAQSYNESCILAVYGIGLINRGQFSKKIPMPYEIPNMVERF